MPARVAREKGHQHFIRKPAHTPLVGEHKVSKAQRLAKEQADREQKARAEAAALVNPDTLSRVETSPGEHNDHQQAN
jgi:hypothetical protein